MPHCNTSLMHSLQPKSAPVAMPIIRPPGLSNTTMIRRYGLPTFYTRDHACLRHAYQGGN